MNMAATICLSSPSNFSITATLHTKEKFFPRNTLQTHNLTVIKPQNNKKVQTKRRKPWPDLQNNVSVARRLWGYLEMGCYEGALDVFVNTCKRSRFIWNVFIRCLTDNEFFREAIYFYHRMVCEGIGADYYTFPSVLKACVGVFSLVEGERIHARVIKMGLDVDLYICNSLIIMYSKLECLEQSETIFGDMPVKDLVSWNSMISGYGSSGYRLSALTCFRDMQGSRGLSSDRFTMISILGVCSSMDGYLLNGKEVHCQVIRRGLDLDSMIETSLVDMYGKYGLVGYSEKLFTRVPQRTIAIWNAIIGAYARNDEPLKSFSCFQRMQESDKLVPDAVTSINLLPSCTRMRALLQGRCIHGFAVRRGILPHLVFETALADMYGKCGSLSSAENIFFRMKEKNLISWNAIIAAYVHNGFEEQAIKLFLDLSHECIEPDEITFVNLLPAYAEIVLPKEGKQIHGNAMKLGFGSNTFICNSLIYMYAKCGDIRSAEKVFNCTVFKNLISWNSIIMACGIHGLGEISVRLFSNMVQEGMKPNASTFVSLLTSCSISGLVDEGREYFNSMRTEYDMDPGIEHYGCILDLLGRSGDLELAKLVIDEMPLTPTARIWGSLLAASRCHKNIELAELAADHILSLGHDNTGYYVLLANMYAEMRRWTDVERIRRSMENHGLRKTIARSKVEHNGKIYQFTNHDCSQAEESMIYEALDIISRKTVKNLYVSSVYNKFQPADVVRRKANSTMWHSVRLAICFGLISTSIGAHIVVRKNVRICEECHNVAKKISQMTNREILVGDAKMYHHFRNGECSCKDYW